MREPTSTSSRMALISPTTSEHQYDIPFSHLTPSKQQQQQQQQLLQPDYDNVLNSNWGGSTLLQPRVVNGLSGGAGNFRLGHTRLIYQLWSLEGIP